MKLEQESFCLDTCNAAQAVRVMFEAIRDESKARNVYSTIISSIERLKTTAEAQAEWGAVISDDDEDEEDKAARKKHEKEMRRRNKDGDMLIKILKEQVLPIIKELLKDENNHVGRLLEAVRLLDGVTNEQVVEGIEGK